MEALHSGLFQELYSLNEAVRAQDFTFRTQLVLTVALLSAAYLHLFVRRHAPGLKSLLLILPVVVINCWAPLWFDPAQELITRVVLGLLLFWLGNFKAVGLCLNRGPISGDNWNLVQVCLLYLGPMYPRQDGPVKKGRLTDSAGPTSKLFSLAAGHAVMLSLLAYVLAEVPLPTTVKHYVYALALCSFISFLMNGPAAVLTSLAELDVVPPFDRPWMSSSLADFWSRRWNNTVSLTLRSLIYDPIVEGTWIHTQQPTASAAAAGAGSKQQPTSSSTTTSDSSSRSSSGDMDGTSTTSSSGPPAAAAAASKPPRVHPVKKLAGTAATFAVSGIMHEFILLYALREGNSYPAGFWFMFFFSQVPLLIIEDMVRRKLRKAGRRLARPVTMGWTTAILMFTAYFFWYPPVEQYTDIALRVVTSVNAGAAAAVGGVQGLFQQLRPPVVGGAALVGSVSQAAL